MQRIAKWLKTITLQKLGAKTNFANFCSWRKKVEGAFHTNLVVPDHVSPADLTRLGYIFFAENFHQHLEEEGTLGETGMRWKGLIRHLENREFDFTYAKLEGELEKLK